MNYKKIINVAVVAGEAIIEIYNRDHIHFEKADSSPLTEADLAAHKIILNELMHLTPNLPVLSEESSIVEWETRSQWTDYWLVDPLDGTKEFLNRNGEFTVNIARIKNGQPVWGVVYAPTTGVAYAGGTDSGCAIKITKNLIETPLQVSAVRPTNANWTIVGSRSHQSNDFTEFTRKFSEPEIKTMGSSLKICMVADGTADIYPRLGLTSEWDTAAAHAVLLGAGGVIIDAEKKLPLMYNQKESLLNPFFIAANGISTIWTD